MYSNLNKGDIMTAKKESKQDRASRMTWKPEDLKVTKTSKNETNDERRQRIAAAAKRLED
jgi:hypothetical protein